jgi:hypothetical protein
LRGAQQAIHGCYRRVNRGEAERHEAVQKDYPYLISNAEPAD